MKTFYLVLFFGLFLNTGIAQTKNVDVNNLYVTYRYRDTPLKPWDKPCFIYSTSVNANGVTLKNISVPAVENALFIEGQVKTKIPEVAMMSLELTLDNIRIASSNVSERVKEEKRNGKVEKTHFYSVIVVYSFTSSYTLKLADGTVLENVPLSSGKIESQLPEYGTSKEASNYWENNRARLVAEFYMNFAMESAKTARNYLSFKYGFPAVEKKDNIKITDEKKHLENQRFKNSAELLKKVIESMTPDIPMKLETIDTVIIYYENIPKRYASASSKADASLRYAAYFNLCKIYVYSDNPDKAMEYADLLIANGVKPKDGENMKKEIEELRKTLDRVQIKTRHFTPEKVFLHQ